MFCHGLFHLLPLSSVRDAIHTRKHTYIHTHTHSNAVGEEDHVDAGEEDHEDVDSADEDGEKDNKDDGQGGEEAGEEGEEDDLSLAWEMLEVARAIYTEVREH
jgi:uncharacterized sporulation protein YeaH/YhbH (DUF444 family)